MKVDFGLPFDENREAAGFSRDCATVVKQTGWLKFRCRQRQIQKSGRFFVQIARLCLFFSKIM